MLESNMAGIIPISGQKRADYQFPWHDCLMPIGKEYYAIQKAVYECALVGCKTIWIVSDLQFQPLIKEIVQEWVMDPFTIDKQKDKEAYDHVRVPIYYVPIHGKDRERRDCLAWSILYGCSSAESVSYSLSRWLGYEKYYISFPHGVFDVDLSLRHFREGGPFNLIASPEQQFLLSHSGSSVVTGAHTSFTMSKAQVKKSLSTFRSLERHEAKKIKNPAKHFSLDNVFKNLYDGVQFATHELDCFYQINTWEKYREFMGSDLAMEKPRTIEKFERRKKRWKRMFHED